MEVLGRIGELAIGLFIFYYFLAWLGYWRQRSIVPNKYEWLTLLHHHDWVVLNTLYEKMEEKKRTDVPLRGLQNEDLRVLYMQGLVRTRRVPDQVFRIGIRLYPVFEVQLTMKGSQEKNKYLNSLPRRDDTDDDDDSNGRLIPV